MTTKRVLFDLTIAGVTLFTIYEVTKYVDKKRKYQEVSTPDHPTVSESKEEEGVIKKTAKKIVKKIKRAAKKVVSFLIEYQPEIDSITSALGLIAACYTLKDVAGKSKTPNYISSNPSDSKSLVDRMLEHKNGVIENCPNDKTLRWNVESSKDKSTSTAYDSRELSKFVNNLMDSDYGKIIVPERKDKLIRYTVENVAEEVAA